uniref:Secreted protein n=1 Tax=Bosea sp. NBC_00436 TaxID=2969620 RepID=A0A9E8CJB8_9HYPH
MTRQARGGGPWRVRLRLVAAILAGTIAASSAAQASDADLQRALLDRGCVAPLIETVLQQRDLVAYRANCLGTSHKIITVVCSKGRCSPSPSNGDRDRP